MWRWIDVDEEPIGGRRISNKQGDVKKVEQIVEKFDEIVGGHDS